MRVPTDTLGPDGAAAPEEPSTSRILVLEDEPLIAMMLQNWLTQLHCETIGPAHSVASALALLDGVTLDGALLDLSLRNNETCYSVAAALRARGVPFVFATGYDAPVVDASFRGTLILSKPFDFEAMKGAVSRLRSEVGAAIVNE